MNRSEFFYTTLKTALDAVSGLDVVDIIEPEDLMKSTTPKAYIEIGTETSTDKVSEGAFLTKIGTSSVVDFQIYVGFAISKDTDQSGDFRQKLHELPELIEQGLEAINLPATNTFTSGGFSQTTTIVGITTPDNYKTPDVAQQKGLMLFDGKIYFNKK